MRILVFHPLTNEQIAELRSLACPHEVVVARTEKEAVRLVGSAEVLITRFSRSVLQAGDNLRWVQSISSGVDRFMLPEPALDGVVLTSMAGVKADQGSEHAWALLLSLSRGIHHSVLHQQDRTWRGGPAVVLRGATLGIVGLGGFGTGMARKAAGFDMRVLAVDLVRRERPEFVDELRPSTPEDLHDLLRRSDVVMIACPLTRSTLGLIGHEQFAVMRESAFFVHVTRGGIVDEQALMEALRAGRIAGAALDVCAEEPLPPDSPLWETPNLIITSHQSASSQHGHRQMFEFARDNLRRYLNGEPLLNVVDPERGF
jgi:phosphoglycerate dehydrogenase-like enzyme